MVSLDQTKFQATYNFTTAQMRRFESSDRTLAGLPLRKARSHASRLPHHRSPSLSGVEGVDRCG